MKRTFKKSLGARNRLQRASRQENNKIRGRIRRIRGVRNRNIIKRNRRSTLINNKKKEIENKEVKKLNDKINDLTESIQKMNLGGGPIRNPTRSLIKKEIRNDRVYSAMSLYLRNQNMSLFESNQKIVYFNNYNACTAATGAQHTYLLWYPYFFPCINPEKMKMVWDDTNTVVNACSNLFYGYGSRITNLYESNQIKVYGMQRLVCATLKISNITPNTNKGGAYTIYKLTSNYGTPIIYNNTIAFDANITTHDIGSNEDVMFGKYQNSSVRYLFSGNEVGIIDEYNVTQGNTIFCNWQEYLGNRIMDNNSDSLEIHGSCAGWAEKNPQGVNIKYLIDIDPTNPGQTYKVETWSLYEVVPPQDSFLATTATMPTHIASKSVIEEIKSKFPIHKGF